ncbi:MAG: hypothetical protein U0840_13700 [Gemmataceae bacterium]
MHRITLLFALTVLVGVSAAPAAEPLDNLKTLMPKDLAEKVTPKVGIDFWPGIDGELRMVTSTKVNGKGSITEALGRPGKAIIAVMADIDLEGQTIGIPSEVTLTGRFADMPPQILRGQVVINSSNVRVDQLAFRPGDLKMIKAVWEPVSLIVTGKGTKNVVISNCSLTWGVDGNAAVMSKIADGIDGAPSDVLFYRCLIGQSLHRCPTHRKNRAGDGRSCGLLINDFCQRVGVVECMPQQTFFNRP